MSYHGYLSFRAEDEHQKGHDDERYGRSDYDHDRYSDRVSDRAYFQGREDERRAEDRRREERAEEEAAERRAHERAAQARREEEDDQERQQEDFPAEPFPQEPEGLTEGEGPAKETT